MKTYTDAREAKREVVESEREVLDIVGVPKNDERCTFGENPSRRRNVLYRVRCASEVRFQYTETRSLD